LTPLGLKVLSRTEHNVQVSAQALTKTLQGRGLLRVYDYMIV